MPEFRATPAVRSLREAQSLFFAAIAFTRLVDASEQM
jgi:hypothetical protein